MYTGFACIKGSNPLLSVLLSLVAFHSFQNADIPAFWIFYFRLFSVVFDLRCTKCAQIRVARVLAVSGLPALFADLRGDARTLFE